MKGFQKSVTDLQTDKLTEKVIHRGAPLLKWNELHFKMFFVFKNGSNLVFLRFSMQLIIIYALIYRLTVLQIGR